MKTNQLYIIVTIMMMFLLSHLSSASSSHSSSSSSHVNRMDWALESSRLEQAVEDYNALLVAAATTPLERVTCRRLICMPLDERFDPPMGAFSHRHVQTGDKMSLPHLFWQAVSLSGAEVPWLFQVERIDGVTMERVVPHGKNEFSSMEPLNKVVGGALDFRAPSNYVFLPWWMMRSLGLQPRDVVQVSLYQKVPPGSTVIFRPHSSKFTQDIANHQAVMETELKHYSSLCKGSTIAFDYNKERYWFDVVDLRSAPRGEKVPMAKVQDCDIATDFVPAKDVVHEKKKKKKQQQQEEE